MTVRPLTLGLTCRAELHRRFGHPRSAGCVFEATKFCPESFIFRLYAGIQLPEDSADFTDCLSGHAPQHGGQVSLQHRRMGDMIDAQVEQVKHLI